MRYCHRWLNLLHRRSSGLRQQPLCPHYLFYRPWTRLLNWVQQTNSMCSHIVGGQMRVAEAAIGGESASTVHICLLMYVCGDSKLMRLRKRVAMIVIFYKQRSKRFVVIRGHNGLTKRVWRYGWSCILELLHKAVTRRWMVILSFHGKTTLMISHSKVEEG